MKIIRLFHLAIIAGCLLFTTRASAAGVTIITHGLNGNADGWVSGMANQIPNYPTFPGSSHTFYKLYFIPVGGGFELTWSRLRGNPPSSTDSGEIIIALDWSQLADGNSFNTYQVAAPVAAVLQNPNFIPELNGHALSELPLHLIGHSRGGSLMSEVSKILGSNGIWVDHLTTLDPHPLNDPAFPFDSFLYSAVDAPARTYQNVLFHDNYWQNVDFLVNGQSVSGAYVRKLTNLSGGYSSPHSDTHLWYHGTVDQRNPANDTEAQITTAEFNNWYSPYEQLGDKAGFVWSLIGRGNRTSSDRPVGAAFPAIRDGYNQTWDLGAGQSANRTSLPSNNGNWPNVMKFNLVSTNQAQQGANITVKHFYQSAQPSNSVATLSFYLDDDLNPLNSNSRLLEQLTVPGNGAGFVSSQTLDLELNTTNAPPGLHALYAKITRGGRTRYLYAPETLLVVPGPDITVPVVFITNPTSPMVYTNAQTVTISANAADNVAVASVAFYDGLILKGTDAVAPYSYDWSFAEIDNGVHSWTARAYDGAGNTSTSTPIVLTVSIDTTPPIIAISSPTNGANLTTSMTLVSGTAADPGAGSSGLSVIELRVNGGNWINATGTGSWSLGLALQPCDNTIEARSRDHAGNFSSIALISVTYAPANTAPNTPVNILPINSANDVSVAPQFQAGPFSDADCFGDTHAASQWQILNSAGAAVVVDSGTNAVDKLTWTLPPDHLHYGSDYQWRVRFQDSRQGWSAYSTPTVFTTVAPSLSGSREGTNMVFRWPTNTSGFVLQWSTNAGAVINWSDATPSAEIVGGQNTVTNNLTNSIKFYRLKK